MRIGNLTENPINCILKEILFNRSLTVRLNAIIRLIEDPDPEVGWLVDTLIRSGKILKENDVIECKAIGINNIK